MGRIAFLILNTIDGMISRWRPQTAARYIPGGKWDRWDHFLETANIKLWPEYDGEGWLG